MNRMEEALRRALRSPQLPESVGAPDIGALDRFRGVDAGGNGHGNGQVPQPGHESEIDAVHGTVEPEPDPRAVQGGAPTADNDVAATELILDSAFRGKLVISEKLNAGTVEQYRRLAATLHQAQCNDGIKIVMIASALAGEGKTLTAMNLALTLSESYGRRVLLIDADLRRPALHKAFQLPNASGLNDGLKAGADRKLTVLEISPRLALLPAGKPEPDPMSVLTSDRMRRVIQEAASKFDWVVIDTPPVALLPDAHLLAAMVNVVVLVVDAGRTPCALIQRAIDSLDRGRIVGVVLNRVEDRAVSPGGKYERYYASAYGRPPDAQAETPS
jgi:protein-tyrosine kinase